MKKQIILVKGGEAKENYKDFYDYLEKEEFNPYKELTKRWNRNLGEKLGEDSEVITIPMPNKHFADYKAWKIMFEKIIPYLSNSVIFIGHSLGGTFLVKYFNEEKTEFLEKIDKIILIAPGFKDSKKEVLGTFNFNKNLKTFKELKDKIIIFGSEDDFVVDFSDIEDFRKILSNAIYRIFKNKGHFLQEEFPELLKEIKSKNLKLFLI